MSLGNFGVAKEAVKQVVAHKVCGVGTTMTCRGMATVRPGAKVPYADRQIYNEVL